MTENVVKNAERVIDAEISATVQGVEKYLQAERNRIVASSSTLENGDQFRRSAEFDDAFGRLLEVPFSAEDADTIDRSLSSMAKTAPPVVEEEEAPVKKSSAYYEKTRKRPRPKQPDDYDEMEAVYTVEGLDCLFKPIIGPSNIIALPGRNRFAVLHEDRISILSPSGDLEETFELNMNEEYFSGSGSGVGARFLTANPLVTDEVFCIDRGHVKAFHLEAGTGGEIAVETTRLFNAANHWLTTAPAYGLATCGRTRQLFAVFKNQIASISLDNWSLLGSRKIEPEKLANRACIVGVRNDHDLFFTTDYKSLNMVPIGKDGKVHMEKVKTVASDYKDIRAVCFDPEGNIFLTNKARNRIEVLSKDGEQVLSMFQPPRSYFNFSPSDIAMLTAPNDGELFAFNDGTGPFCSRVVVTPDFLAKKIVIFGVPQDAS